VLHEVSDATDVLHHKCCIGKYISLFQIVIVSSNNFYTMGVQHRSATGPPRGIN
jgi:hypothetical protein